MFWVSPREVKIQGVGETRPRLALEAEHHRAILIIAADLAAGESAAAMQEVVVTVKADVDECVAHRAAAAVDADVTAGPVGDRRRHDLRFGGKVRRGRLVRRTRRLRARNDNERRGGKQKVFHFPQTTCSRSLRVAEKRSSSRRRGNNSLVSGSFSRTRTARGYESTRRRPLAIMRSKNLVVSTEDRKTHPNVRRALRRVTFSGPIRMRLPARACPPRRLDFSYCRTCDADNA